MLGFPTILQQSMRLTQKLVLQLMTTDAIFLAFSRYILKLLPPSVAILIG